MDKRPSALFLGSLIGNQVRDENGVSLGRIEELVIDPDTGRVKSVVLSMGNAPAFQNAACAIPWESFRLGRSIQVVKETRVEAVDESAVGKFKRDNTCTVYTFSVNRSL